MANYRASGASTINMDSITKNWKVDNGIINQANSDETYWDFPESNERLGYYNLLPELKKSIDIVSMYTTGKGYYCPSVNTQIRIKKFIGWGEDTFESICWNLLVQKKVFGDAFAEIIRDEEKQIINLKPLYTGDMRIVCNKKGFIIRYEVRQTQGGNKEFKPYEIFHLVNERIANQIHGTSIVDSVAWVIEAKNEALDTMRKIQRRQLALGYLEYEGDDTAELDKITEKYKQAMNNGWVFAIPKGVIELKQAPANQIITILLEWIRYLDDFSYRALGVPLVLAGGSGGSEGSDKTGFLTFDQVWKKEQRELSADIWNQLGFIIYFEEPASINPEMLSNETKNTSQTRFQPKDATAGVERE